MSKSKPPLTNDNQGRGLDRKAVFDAGYDAYENAQNETDYGPNAEASAGDPAFTALWRYGWQRAHEDSALSNHVVSWRTSIYVGSWGLLS